MVELFPSAVTDSQIFCPVAADSDLLLAIKCDGGGGQSQPARRLLLR